MNIAILGSTNGTSFKALLPLLENHTETMALKLVLSDKANAGIIAFATEKKIPFIIHEKGRLTRISYDEKLNAILKAHHIDLVVLIGFMRILSKPLLDDWQNKIINIHPSLLPKHQGLMNKAVHQAVLDKKEKRTGCTAHYVTKNVDDGPVICQKECMVSNNDTVETLQQKVQALEPHCLLTAITHHLQESLNMQTIMPKRALISVSDKTDVLTLANVLLELNIEILSTGGTFNHLIKANFPVKHISDITQFPEIMGGRVKTLNPLLLGGILGRRHLDKKEATEYHIPWIDMVVCNLYPFEKTIADERCTLSDAVENIDIGGPTMLRAAAKNFFDVSVICEPADYNNLITLLKNGGIPFEKRKQMAYKAFTHTARYDSLISNYFCEEPFPDTVVKSYQKKVALRYGENPHQKACLYQQTNVGLVNAKQHQGKTLSFNNLVDAQAAIDAIAAFNQPACVVIKHAMPCGLATSDTIGDAFNNSFNADAKSAFGGVIALNRDCNEAIADYICKHFVEIVIAPSYSQKAITLLKNKTQLRVLELPIKNENNLQLKPLSGGLLLQEKDNHVLMPDALQTVTKTTVSLDDKKALLFAWQCVKAAKSNAIAITKNNVSIAIAGGHVSRIDAVDMAIAKAGNKTKEAFLASDAFFPFRDSIDTIAKAGIKAIIQPGGSKRDNEVIEACNEYGIAMVFTHHRCFYH